MDNGSTKKLDVAESARLADEADKRKQPETYKQVQEPDMEDAEVERKHMDGALEKMLPKDPVADVKFINDKQNGDTKLDISDLKSEFVGMGKEELMKFANDPFWVRLRWILFVGFWLLWAGMLVGAVLIIVAAPKCAPPEPRTWWERGPLSEIPSTVPREVLETAKANGIEGIFIDFPGDAYALNNFEQLTNLLIRPKILGLNAIITLNPGSSALWFRQSEGKDDQYSNYYLWADAKGQNASGQPIPPNNWLSPANKSSWQYSEVRQQFYLTLDNSPQLNMRNPAVATEFAKVLRYYMHMGFKGVRLRNGPGLLVDPQFQDESISNKPGFFMQDYGFYTHAKTTYLDGLAALLKEWRSVVKNETTEAVFMLEGDLDRLEPFKSNGTLVVDLPSHSRLFARALGSRRADRVREDLKAAFRVLDDHWPLWRLDSNPSLLDGIGSLPQDVLDHVTFLLQGATLIPLDRKVDQELLSFRKDSPSIMHGSCSTYSLNNDTVFAFIRVTPRNPGYLVAVNLQEERVVVDFPKGIAEINEDVTVQFVSKNYNETDIETKFKIKANKVPISPLSSIVLSYVPKD